MREFLVPLVEHATNVATPQQTSKDLKNIFIYESL